MRHVKRDEEAGGPGLGVLDTRKRTRRLPDGSIITRPTKRQSRSGKSSNSNSIKIQKLPPSLPSSMSSSTGSPPSSSGHSECSNRNNDFPPDGAPASPPYSMDRASRFSSNLSLNNETLDESVRGADVGDDMDGDDSLLAPMMPGGPYEPFVEPIPGQFDVADGAWQTNTMLPASSMDVDNFEDAFDLDTGIYYVIPFFFFFFFYMFIKANSLN